MGRLYADEDFSYPLVDELRQLGHDVVTAQESGQANSGTTDDEILAFAIAEQRAVVTFNRRHFIRLHQQAPVHFGIIVCTRDSNIVGLAGRIVDSITNAPTLENQLIRVNRPLQS